MNYNYIYLLSLAFLPVQNIGLSLGFMTLKVSQALFLAYFLIAIFDKKNNIPKISGTVLLLFFSFIGMMISTLFSDNIERSVVLTFAYFLCLIFFVTTNIFMCSNVNAVHKIKNILYISSFFYSLYGIVQLILFFLGFAANVNFEAWDVVPRVPYFSAENVHAAFLLVVIPLIYVDYLSNKNKFYSVLYLILILVNFGGLVATGSRGAMISAAVALILQTVFYFPVLKNNGNFFKTGFLYIVVFALIGVFFDDLFLRFSSLVEGDDGTASVRRHHYSIVYGEFSESIFFGIGMGRSLAMTGHDVHNLFFQILFEGGILSFSPFFISLLSMVFGILYFNGVVNYGRNSHLNNLGISAMGVLIAVVGQSLMEPSLYFYHLYFAFALSVYFISCSVGSVSDRSKNNLLY